MGDARDDMGPVGRQCKDALGVILASDDAVAELLGWTPEELVGRRSLDFLHPDDHDRAVEVWMSLLQGAPDTVAVVRHRHAAGHWMWVQLHNRNEIDRLGQVSTEISQAAEPPCQPGTGPAGPGAADRPEAGPNLLAGLVREHDRMLRTIVETLPSGILQLTQKGLVVFTNRQAGTLLGLDRVVSADDVVRAVLEPDRPRLRAAIGRVLEHAEDGQVEAGVAVGRMAAPRAVSFTLRALRDDAETSAGAILCMEDVTEAMRLRAELELRASTDVLTGCRNRASILTAIQAELDRGPEVAVVYVDVDHFKSINDRWGHHAGDRVLVAVTQRLAAAVRAGDVVGRIGGDEFLVMCPAAASTGLAMAVAERLAAQLCAPVELGSDVLDLRVSIGVAHASDVGRDADALIAAADAAMYRAKRDRAGVPALYVPDDVHLPVGASAGE